VDTPTENRLKEFFENESEELWRILRLYVLRFGLADGREVGDVTTELLQETVVEVLRAVERFPENATPLAWCVGIALNLMKRKRSKNQRRIQREPLFRDSFPAESLSDGEIIDRFFAETYSHSDQIDHSTVIEQILEQASPSDAEILRLAIEHHFNGEKIACELGISAGAARVRLHRAIQRQREFFQIDRESILE
jgi:RNA polymerase sigma-70 factor (ECF subfamily)